MAREANDANETCREPGCDLRALPGRAYCLWHPRLELLRETPARRAGTSKRDAGDEDPWGDCRSALERHPEATAD